MRKCFLLLLPALFLTGCGSDDVVIDDIRTSQSISIAATGDLWPDKFSVTITPSAGIVKYEYAIGTSDADMTAFENGSLNGVFTVDPSEVKTVEFTSLTPAATYIVLARGIDKDGVKSPVASVKVRTLADDFVVTEQWVAPTSAAIKVECTTDFYSYTYAIGKPEDRTAFEKGTLAGALTATEVTDMIYNFFDLAPGTTYSVFVKGLNRISEETGVFQIDFTTPNRDEVPFADFSTVSIDPYQGEFMAVPNAKCGKISVFVQQTGSWDATMFGDGYAGDLIACFQAWESVNMNVISAVNEPFHNYLRIYDLTYDIQAGVTFDAYVMVYDHDDNAVGIAKYYPEVPPLDNTLPPAGVTVQVVDVTETGATYIFTADENTLGFLYDTVDAAWYDNMVATNGEAYAQDMLRNDYNIRYGKFNYAPAMPVCTWTETTATPDTKYYAAAVPLDFNGFTDPDWGLPVVMVPFTTRAIYPSSEQMFN